MPADRPGVARSGFGRWVRGPSQNSGRKQLPAGNLSPLAAFFGHMFRYRFITPHRRGKWYPDLQTAQRFAAQIGAGFMESRTGRFFAYRGTKLEVAPA
jgi:hypothetical protein